MTDFSATYNPEKFWDCRMKFSARDAPARCEFKAEREFIDLRLEYAKAK
jgi:hypothetical protein